MEINFELCRLLLLRRLHESGGIFGLSSTASLLLEFGALSSINSDNDFYCLSAATRFFLTVDHAGVLCNRGLF